MFSSVHANYITKWIFEFIDLKCFATDTALKWPGCVESEDFTNLLQTEIKHNDNSLVALGEPSSACFIKSSIVLRNICFCSFKI